MTGLNTISSVYFLGIGGIGMSALARYFHQHGVRVSGYDKTATILTRELEAEGMQIHYTDDMMLADKQASLVVYTPAIPADHTELQYFRTNGFPLKKRSEVLGMITRDTFSVAVAGTHGKTTTSTLIAHILRHTGYGCNAFLGGISGNYDTNFWSHSKAVSVCEADEYDRSFLQLHPNLAVITSMDADHLDIYGTAEALEEAFIQFASQVKPGGTLIHHASLQRAAEFKVSRLLRYSAFDTSADVYADKLERHEGAYYFDIVFQGERYTGFTLAMGGEHNIENTVAAFAAVHSMGLEVEKVKEAIAAFRGVRRRFEYVMRNSSLVMIDDYAHHPEELRALISSAKSLFPGKRCTVVFQPHLYSRTKDHADGFAEVLSMADELILLPIYPARELPMPGVDSAMIASRITGTHVQLMEKEILPAYFTDHTPELLIMAGAGDIDTMVKPVQEVLQNRKAG